MVAVAIMLTMQWTRVGAQQTRSAGAASGQTDAQSTAPATDSKTPQLVADHATLVVADADKEAKFYSDVLGFHKRGCNQSMPGRPPFLQHPATVCGLTNGSFAIDLIQEPGSLPYSQESDYLADGWSDLCFYDAALNETYKHLVELGVRIRADKNGKGEVNHIMVWDPEGNRIAIASFSEARPTR
jgi:catechol 2,3-dioxygenase-like lactoylglutathione lyase family enzyme